VRQAPDTSFLPSAAVTPIGGPGATTATVQVLGPDGQPQPRTIGIGLTSDSTTQVTSGLSRGELVVLPDPTTPNPFGQGGPPRNNGGGGQGGGARGGGGTGG
jgi:hypothetical protein